MGRSQAETRRLMTQAELYGRVTRRFLEDAGISTGMKVLDVGSGAGDVAYLAAEIVGPTGQVVGIDANAVVLATARERARAEGLDRVTFVEGDYQTATLDDDFDAAVGRFVLTHAEDVIEALGAIARHVRPGGVAAFAEADLTTGLGYVQTLPPGAIRSAWDWSVEAMRRAGLRINMAPVLREAFVEAGLGEPHMFLHAPLGCRADWPGYDVDAETMRSLLPVLEKLGIATSEEVDADTLAARYRAEVVRTGIPFMMLPLVTAWGQKSATASSAKSQG
ncbi:MAG: class I SAM-dependent methyltransferase [Dehalococcoidia bacterium]